MRVVVTCCFVVTMRFRGAREALAAAEREAQAQLSSLVGGGGCIKCGSEVCAHELFAKCKASAGPEAFPRVLPRVWACRRWIGGGVPACGAGGAGANGADAGGREDA